MWLINWLINSVPLWVWVVIAGGILLATYSLWLPIWNLLPSKVKVVLIGIATIGLAYLGGRYKGARDERELQKQRQREALQKRAEVEREVSQMSDPQVDEKLKPWIRPDE